MQRGIGWVRDMDDANLTKPIEPFKEGYDAFIAGRGAWACPYTPASSRAAWLAWLDGYDEGSRKCQGMVAGSRDDHDTGLDRSDAA